MQTKRAKFLSLALALCLCLSTAAGAVPGDTLDATIEKSAEYMVNTVKAPQVGVIGGEWAVLGLARSGYAVPDGYFEDYYTTAVAYVKAHNGILHERKYTEYSRLIVALTAIGQNPADVGGYNLLTPLGDYEKTIWQGVNGPIWALIALDSGDYPMPQNPTAATQATRKAYLQRILDCQLSDGGWSLFGGTSSATERDSVSSADITGMALQALAHYREDADVKEAIEKALVWVSKAQLPDGGYVSDGTINSESSVQILIGLAQLGISLDDPRFVKNGKTVLDSLMTYHLSGGGFLHTMDEKSANQMATEQGLYALVAARRLRDGAPGLYSMSDAPNSAPVGDSAPKKGEGLAGKDGAVLPQRVVAPGKTFADIAGHKNQAAIESLAARGILNGKTADQFDPNGAVTRAEFASIIVKALGLAPKAVAVFADVAADTWYAPVVGTAYTAGVVTGIDGTHFNPEGKINRQEAAVMVARAGKLCGMDTAFDTVSAKDVISQFFDYITSADWARPSLAFCYSADILPQSDDNIEPLREMTRCEIAQMVENLLRAANLLEG